MSLTIKAGTAYDAPWLVLDDISLDEQRSKLLQFAGLTEETTMPSGSKASELSLMQLTVAIGKLFTSEWRGAEVRTIKQESSARPSTATPAAAKEPEVDVAVDVRKQIAEAKSKAELTSIFNRYASLMEQDSSLMEALKTRAASL